MRLVTDVGVRPVTEDDAGRLLALNRASEALHHPWVAPPRTVEAMRAYLDRLAAPETVGLLAETAEGEAVGVFTVSQIFRGGFQNAYLGFYGFASSVGRGLMTAGLRATLAHVFGPLGLHRVEANVQPTNARSRALVERVGFRHEGFSPRYLYIDGAWRDHERYAMTVEDHVPREVPGDG